MESLTRKLDQNYPLLAKNMIFQKLTLNINMNKNIFYIPE
jgi:hypothetical protein